MSADAPNSARPGASHSSPPPSSEAFERALRAVSDAPADELKWQELERWCEQLERPEDVAGTYIRLLTPSQPTEVLQLIAQRALEFHSEWFGEDIDSMRALVTHIIETVPDSGWAFEQLVSVLTVAERWDELLDAYDQVLRLESDPTRRRQLLDDAAHLAKDFSGQPTRAVPYATELMAAHGETSGLLASLERVLEDEGAWDGLLDLLEAQIELARRQGREVAALRLRVATVALERLDDAGRAMAQLSLLLAESPGDERACTKLLNLMDAESADQPLREDALRLLRLHHDAANRAEDAIAALEKAIALGQREQVVDLRLEVAERLARRGEDARALAHYAASLCRRPDDASIKAQLALIAERSELHPAHADALESAATECKQPQTAAALLCDAARVAQEKLGEVDRAIRLARQAQDAAAPESEPALTALRLLVSLLERAGNPQEQLETLELLGEWEQDPGVRHELLARAAELAATLDLTERALDAWENCIAIDPQNLHALSAAIDIALRMERYERAIHHLHRRTKIAPTDRQRRADLVLIAQLQAVALGDDEKALGTWLQIRESFGDDPETIHALDELLTQLGRFEQLAEILSGATEHERKAPIEQMCRLGYVRARQLGDELGAAHVYAGALELAPDNEVARDALLDLVQSPAASKDAVEALVTAYRRTDDWRGLSALLEARLRHETVATGRAHLLQEAAETAEQRGNDTAQALDLYGRALLEAPQLTRPEREMLRHARLSSAHEATASVFREAAETKGLDPARAADLRLLEASLLDEAGDTEGAAAAFAAVFETRPSDRDVARKLVHAAARAGQWKRVTRALCKAVAAHASECEPLLSLVASVASEKDAFGPLCRELASALRKADDVPDADLAVLHAHISRWYEDHIEDLGSACSAATSAVACSPRDLGMHLRLAELQRGAPSPELIDTLLEIDRLKGGDLPAVFEAARVGVEIEELPERMRPILRRLYAHAEQVWLGGDPHDTEPAAQATEWAMETWVALEIREECLQEAARILMNAAYLPFESWVRVELRVRAARLLADHGDLMPALGIAMEVLDRRSADAGFLKWAHGLAETANKPLELIQIIERELALAPDAKTRIALRLELGRAMERADARDSRILLARQNLDESVGHEASLQAAWRFFEQRERYDELYEFITEQSGRMADEGQTETAAGWYRRIAEFMEKEAKDPRAAADALEAASLLMPRVDVFDELIRLARNREDHVATARWLRERLGVAQKRQRRRLLIELADAEERAGQIDAAASTLRAAFDERPSDAKLRERLVEILASQDDKETLAEVIASAAVNVKDEAESVSLARRAASLYLEDLGRPEDLVDVVRHALQHLPEDHDLNRYLAEGLTAHEQYEEAQQVLLALLERYGRGNSGARFAVHVQLATTLRRAGDLLKACDHLEQALKLKTKAVSVMHTLAEVAREAGDLERAEKALRSLHLAAKRGPVELEDGSRRCASEILLELSNIAKERGNAKQAEQLLESALEALQHDTPDRTRVKAALLASGEYGILENVLRDDFADARSPREKARVGLELSQVLERGDGAQREEAFGLSLQLLQHDPGFFELHEQAARLAESLDKQPEYSGRLSALLEGLEPPGDALPRCEIHLRLGQLHENASRNDEAREQYSLAEACGVREADVWRAQLRIAEAEGRDEDQAQLLTRLSILGAAQIDPNDRAAVLYRLAELRLGDADTLEEGADLLREAMKADPRPAHAARIVARVLGERKGDLILLSLLRDITRHCTPEQVVRVVELCEEQGDEAAIEALAGRNMHQTDETLRHRVLRARAELLIRDPAEADRGLDLLRHLLEEYPGDAETERVLLEYLDNTGQHERAIEFVRERLQEAVVAQNGVRSIHYALELNHRADSPQHEAVVIRYLRLVLGLAPDDSELVSALTHRLDNASRDAVKAAALSGLKPADHKMSHTDVVLEAATMFEELGSRNRALRLLESVGHQASHHAGLRQLLAHVYRDEQTWEPLVELLQVTAEMEKEPGPRAAALQEAAELCLEKLQDPERAIGMLERAVLALPEDVEMRMVLAQHLVGVGEKFRAAEQLRAAVERSRDRDEQARLLVKRSKLLVVAGELKLGLESLEHAYRLSPDEARADFARLLAHCRKKSDATDDRRGFQRASMKLAKLRVEEGDHRGAVAILEETLERSDDPIGVLRFLVEQYEALGLADDVASTLIRLAKIERGPRLASVVERLANIAPRVSALDSVHASLKGALSDHADQPRIAKALKAIGRIAGSSGPVAANG